MRRGFQGLSEGSSREETTCARSKLLLARERIKTLEGLVVVKRVVVNEHQQKSSKLERELDLGEVAHHGEGKGHQSSSHHEEVNSCEDQTLCYGGD